MTKQSQASETSRILRNFIPPVSSEVDIDLSAATHFIERNFINRARYAIRSEPNKVGFYGEIFRADFCQGIPRVSLKKQKARNFYASL